MKSFSQAVGFLLLVSLAAAPLAAGAQIPEFDFERLRLDPAAEGSLVQGTGRLAPPGTFRLSYVVHGETQPLTYREDGLLLGNGIGGTDDRVEDYVSDRIGLHFTGSWTVTRWLELHAELPVIAYQIGDDLSAVGVPNPARTAIAAPWVGFRVPLFRDGLFGLDAAVAVDASGPIGTKESVARPEAFVARPRLELGRHFGGFLVGLEGGFLWRQEAVDVGPVDLGHEVVGGLVLASTGAKVRGELALRGAMNFDDLGAHAEALLGVRFRLAAFDAFLMGGPGFGDAPGTPRFRALLGIGWPAQAAGKAAAQTTSKPAPPPSKSAPSQQQKPAATPAPVPLPPPPVAPKAKLEANRIALSEKIMFETGSARIAERSFGLLDEVVTILEANPRVAIVVEGHTDSRGAPGKNRELSANRAEAVKRYLVRRGIDAARVDTRGYGETKPIRSNETEGGREANRRVELRVKK